MIDHCESRLHGCLFFRSGYWLHPRSLWADTHRLFLKNVSFVIYIFLLNVVFAFYVTEICSPRLHLIVCPLWGHWKAEIYGTHVGSATSSAIQSRVWYRCLEPLKRAKQTEGIAHLIDLEFGVHIDSSIAVMTLLCLYLSTAMMTQKSLSDFPFRKGQVYDAFTLDLSLLSVWCILLYYSFNISYSLVPLCVVQ